jgi:hypothetical protein
VKENGAILLTHKKSLIKETSYPIHPVQCGSVATGVVTKVDPSVGVRVHFVGGVYGVIPIAVLAKQSVSRDDIPRLHQAVHCVFLSSLRTGYLLALHIGSAEEIVQSLSTEISKLSQQFVSPHDHISDHTLSYENGSVAMLSGIVTAVDDIGLKIALDDGRLGFVHRHQCFYFSGQ